MNKIMHSINKIAANRTDGAAQLAQEACEAIAAFADRSKGTTGEALLRDLDQIAKALRCSQPDMAPLTSLSREITRLIERRGKTQTISPEFLQELCQLAKRFQKRLKEAKSSIASEFLRHVKNNDAILTHSNSSTVKDALIFAHEMGRNFQVFCLESRPGYEGVELAKKLGEAGIHCSLVVDAASLKMLVEARFTVVGADCVTETFFVNKIGTHSLALGARELSKEFFVLADSTKFVPARLMGLEEAEQPKEEVLQGHYPNVSVINPYFEKIPLQHITGVITEKGCLTPNIIPDMIG